MDNMNDFTAKWDRTKAAVMAAEAFKDFRVTSFRSCRGSDGPAWSCNIRFKGEPCGSARNGGDGGPDDITIAGPGAAAWESLVALVRAEFKHEPDALVMDALLTAHGK